MPVNQSALGITNQTGTLLLSPAHSVYRRYHTEAAISLYAIFLSLTCVLALAIEQESTMCHEWLE